MDLSRLLTKFGSTINVSLPRGMDELRASVERTSERAEDRTSVRPDDRPQATGPPGEGCKDVAERARRASGRLPSYEDALNRKGEIFEEAAAKRNAHCTVKLIARGIERARSLSECD